MTSDPHPVTEMELELLLKGNPDLDHLVITEGEYWRLYLNAEQHLLGRSYLWLTSRYVDCHPFDDLNLPEITELQKFVGRYRKAVYHLWRANMVNVQWWGNEIHAHRGHGHLHLVPRYSETPRFGTRGFPDQRYGKNYHPYKKMILSREELEAIVAELREAMR